VKTDANECSALVIVNSNKDVFVFFKKVMWRLMLFTSIQSSLFWFDAFCVPKILFF
jgi:hypothetical protein